jgi:hypothetical protein
LASIVPSVLLVIYDHFWRKFTWPENFTNITAYHFNEKLYLAVTVAPVAINY